MRSAPRPSRRTMAILWIVYALVFWDLMLLPLALDVPSDIGHALIAHVLSVEISPLELVRWGVHLILFLPLGLAIGTLPPGRTAKAAVCGAVVLAALSEIAQVFVGRTVSAMDLAVDVAAIALGIWLARRHRRATSLGVHVLFSPPATLAVALVTTAIAVHLGRPTTPSWRMWNAYYPLALGDEPGGGRAWSGELHEIAFIDRALGADEAERLSATPGEPLEQHPNTILHYRFDDEHLSTVEGRQRICPLDGAEENAITVTRGAIDALSAGGIAVGPNTRLLAAEAQDLIYGRTLDANTLTVVARVRCTDPGAAGPARIVTLSRDTTSTNLTLGQHRGDYRLRLRNTLTGYNSARPEVEAPNAVRPGEMQTVVASCQESMATLYVDGVESGHITYRPGHRFAHDAFDSPLHPSLVIGLLLPIATCVGVGVFGLLPRLGTSPARDTIAIAVAIGWCATIVFACI